MPKYTVTKNNEYCKKYRDTSREKYNEYKKNYMRDYNKKKAEYRNELIGLAVLIC